ncbi:MAG: hypothetical protein ABIH23_16930, partial [bacterium]
MIANVNTHAHAINPITQTRRYSHHVLKTGGGDVHVVKSIPLFDIPLPQAVAFFPVVPIVVLAELYRVGDQRVV